MNFLFQGNVDYGNGGPIAASAGYSINENGKQKRLNGNAALTYGKGKNFKITGFVERVDENEYKVNAEIDTPLENCHKTKLSVQTKRSPDQKHITSSLQVNTDNKLLSLDTELKLSDISPLVDLKLKSFDGKASQFYFKTNRVSYKESDGEIKIIHEPNNFLFEGNWNTHIDNIEDFTVKVNLNSPPLKLHKLSLEAHNKPGKGDRKIQITIKSAGKNWLSGSTSYQTRDELGKYMAEGSGTFKIKEESSSGNFKYISQPLSSEKNGEDGFDVSLDINLGKRNFDSAFKLTNKHLKLMNSYCENTKECSSFLINSEVKHNGQHDKLILIFLSCQ